MPKDNDGWEESDHQGGCQLGNPPIDDDPTDPVIETEVGRVHTRVRFPDERVDK